MGERMGFGDFGGALQGQHGGSRGDADKISYE